MVILFIRTVIFYIFLTLCLRLMGKRQIGELQLTEFVVALMISDIAVLPITDCDIPLSHGLIPVVTLSCLEIISSFVFARCPRLRRKLEGQPILLMYKGVISEENLQRTRVTMDELFAEVRANGYSDIADIQYIVFEQTGKISIIPKTAKTAATAADVGSSAQENGIAHAVVIDGVVDEAALKAANRTHEWLGTKLGKTPLKRILYMTVDDAGKASIKTRD